MTSVLSFLKHSFVDIDGALLRRLAGDNLIAQHAQGRTLESHLRGTQRVLAAWGQSTVVQRAGLCHSLYSTDAFEKTSVPLSDRRRVQSAIGKQAEELAFLFCAIQRAPFFRTVLRADSLDRSAAIPVEVRKGFESAGQTVSGAQARDLLLLHLANNAEQAGRGNGRPTPWLEQFQRLVRLLADKAPDAVPVALLDFRTIDRYAERQALASYLRAVRMSGNPDVAIPTMEETADLLPGIADPHIWLSWFWALKGDDSKRRQHSRLAKEKLLSLGVAWDKRLPYDEWLALANTGGRPKATDAEYSRLRALVDADAGAAEPTHELMGAMDLVPHTECGNSRFESYLLDVGAAQNRKVSGFYPGLREDSFWPAEQFELGSTLQRHFTALKEEIDALDPEHFHDETERIERTGKWQVLMLLEAGRWNEDNLSRLPALSRILKEARELRLAGGLAYLSRLSPGTVVAPHTGPTNMRLRLHFAIRVPVGNCAMRVAGSERRWVEGESIIFNDFLEHEVWNRTDGERLILLVDLWHPDITAQERKMLEAIHWMAEQHGQGLLEYWKKNEIARKGTRSTLHVRASPMDDLVL
jgi:hypothetical protein